MKKNKDFLCLVETKFLGITFFRYYSHFWRYKNKWERVCEKCGRVEMNINDGEYSNDNEYHLDWRKKYKK